MLRDLINFNVSNINQNCIHNFEPTCDLVVALL